ncbi:MAG: hypothetical protein VYE22_23025 [Myxococcota bacterium]|nr:hypothetical protein [Myxococcota bacterium]
MSRTLGALCACALITALGCDGGETTPEDSGTTPTPDSGTMMMETDSGTGGPRDSGTTPDDSCAASPETATSTVGCNGGLYGSTQNADQLDGTCTPDGMDPPGAGSCMASGGDSQPVCIPDEAMPSMGTCVYVCPPDTSSYITTGGCPSGSRCFTLRDDLAICFRDCNTASDCFDGEECDGEGSCVPMAAPPADGGGAPDGGV